MEANLLLVGVIVIAVVFVLLLSGMWVGLALGSAGLLYLFLFLPAQAKAVATIFFQASNSFILAAIPLFVFMGEILLRSGIGDQLYRGISVWLGRVPGSLAHTNIAACSIFAAVSGSSVATAATIGTVAIPEMLKRGYDRKITFGSIAGGGTLGILIPPSIAMIVYGAVCQVSVGQLFLAGFIPGILLALMFMTYIGIRALLQPKLMPRTTEKIGWKERISAVGLTAPTVLLILVILGGIYAGITTPSEAGAVGAIAALLLALAYRKLNWQVLRESLLSALQTTCMIMLIIMGALTLSFAVGNAGIPRAMIEWVSSFQVPNTVILFFVYLLYIALGCFFEGLSLLLMTIPITFPLVMELGYDPVWFGVMIVIILEMAMLTPPVGLNLYVLHGLSGGRPMSEIIIGTLPFFGIECIGLALFTVFPQIVLFLPSQMV